MKITTTTFLNPVTREPMVDEHRFLTRAWLLWLLPFVGRVRLYLVDTSTGGGTFTLPPASKNQNVEIIIKKITGDGNVVTPVPVAGDTIDVATPISTLAGKARYISDGTKGWYLS